MFIFIENYIQLIEIGQIDKQNIFPRGLHKILKTQLYAKFG